MLNIPNNVKFYRAEDVKIGSPEFNEITTLVGGRQKHFSAVDKFILGYSPKNHEQYELKKFIVHGIKKQNFPEFRVFKYHPVADEKGNIYFTEDYVPGGVEHTSEWWNNNLGLCFPEFKCSICNESEWKMLCAFTLKELVSKKILSRDEAWSFICDDIYVEPYKLHQIQQGSTLDILSFPKMIQSDDAKTVMSTASIKQVGANIHYTGKAPSVPKEISYYTHGIPLITMCA